MKIFEFIQSLIPKPHLKVEFNGSYLVCELNEVADFVDQSMSGLCTVSIVWISERKLKTLPEFQGW